PVPADQYRTYHCWILCLATISIGPTTTRGLQRRTRSNTGIAVKRQLYLLLVSLIWVLSACGSTAADAAITHQQTVGDLQIKLEHPQQAFVLQDYDFKVNV